MSAQDTCEGGQSTVGSELGFAVPSGVFIKEIRPQPDIGVTESELLQEVEITRKLAELDPNSRFVIKMIACYRLSDSIGFSLVLPLKMSWVEFSNKVGKPSTHSEILLRRVFCRQLVESVQFVHKSGYLHLDLKEGNVVIVAEGASFHPLLIDFGNSKQMSQNGTAQMQICMGTEMYGSPEQFGHKSYQKQVSPKSDVFGLGATMLVLFSGETIDGDDHEYKTFIKENSTLYSSLPSIMPYKEMVPDDVWCLVKKCTQHQPEKRPTIEDLLNNAVLLGEQRCLEQGDKQKVSEAERQSHKHVAFELDSDAEHDDYEDEGVHDAAVPDRKRLVARKHQNLSGGGDDAKDVVVAKRLPSQRLAARLHQSVPAAADVAKHDVPEIPDQQATPGKSKKRPPGRPKKSEKLIANVAKDEKKLDEPVAPAKKRGPGRPQKSAKRAVVSAGKTPKQVDDAREKRRKAWQNMVERFNGNYEMDPEHEYPVDGVKCISCESYISADAAKNLIQHNCRSQD